MAFTETTLLLLH